MQEHDDITSRGDDRMPVIAGPSEQRVVLTDIRWETYERLLKDLEQSSVPRLTFDQGVLEIMSPFSDHEENNRNLALLVELFAEEFDIEIRNLGSTTFKREELQRGFEPDSCFYVQHESRIRNRRRIDLRVDPPPDLVIEVDLTNNSMNKLPVFASIGVPEIWRVSDSEIQILRLDNDHYKREATSTIIPPLSAGNLTELLAAASSMRRTAWLKRVRRQFCEMKREIR